MSAAVKTDVLIVGAGPVGLFCAFELGLFDMRCHLVDSLDRPGGQCAALYADKPIYDIPALPSVTAQQLVDRLLLQIAPFQPQFTFNRTVTKLERLSDGWLRVTTDGAELFEAQVVVIAAGGGAFQPKRAQMAGIDAFEGKGVVYSSQPPEDFRGHDVVIVGGGDPALDCAVKLRPLARSVTLVHRRPQLRAARDSVDAVLGMRDRGELDLRTGTVAGLKGEGGVLRSVLVTEPEGDIEIPCTRLLPVLGVTTKPGPIAEWGLNLRDDTIPVDTERFATCIQGVFAVGDISYYPGKLRLLLSGFHEAALMAQAARRIVSPGARIPLEYTTSSTALQKRLGVA